MKKRTPVAKGRRACANGPTCTICKAQRLHAAGKPREWTRWAYDHPNGKMVCLFHCKTEGEARAIATYNHGELFAVRVVEQPPPRRAKGRRAG